MKIEIVNEKQELKTEETLRLIRIPAGFGCGELLVAETPITEGQWISVMGGKLLNGRDYPKTDVNYSDAESFCEKLSKQTGLAFRLPTEMEFCRCLGEEPQDLERYAVFEQGTTAEVKTKLPNEYGLYDMRGNVWEWTSTKEGDSYILRGGSWFDDRVDARAVSRNYFHAAGRFNRFGFRVVGCRPFGCREQRVSAK